jgi:hypothetical protein
MMKFEKKENPPAFSNFLKEPLLVQKQTIHQQKALNLSFNLTPWKKETSFAKEVITALGNTDTFFRQRQKLTLETNKQTLVSIPTKFVDLPMGWLWQDSKHSQGNQETSFAKEVPEFLDPLSLSPWTTRIFQGPSVQGDQIGWGPFVHGDRILGDHLFMETELIGDRLFRVTNQLGTNCGRPNV